MANLEKLVPSPPTSMFSGRSAWEKGKSIAFPYLKSPESGFPSAHCESGGWRSLIRSNGLLSLVSIPESTTCQCDILVYRLPCQAGSFIQAAIHFLICTRSYSKLRQDKPAAAAVAYAFVKCGLTDRFIYFAPLRGMSLVNLRVWKYYFVSVQRSADLGFWLITTLNLSAFHESRFVISVKYILSSPVSKQEFHFQV